MPVQLTRKRKKNQIGFALPNAHVQTEIKSDRNFSIYRPPKFAFFPKNRFFTKFDQLALLYTICGLVFWYGLDAWDRQLSKSYPTSSESLFLRFVEPIKFGFVRLMVNLT